MTPEQQRHLLHSIGYTNLRLREIEAGKETPAQTWQERTRWADWQLRFLLKDLLPALSEEIRAGVQACLDINDHMWSEAYRDACRAQQKQADPLSVSLAQISLGEKPRI